MDELCDHVDFRRLYLSYWTITESISVIVRKRNRGELPTRDMSAAVSRLLAETARMQPPPINGADAQASIRYIFRHSLNATDALHLFVALRLDGSVNSRVTMVSSDSRLLRAADAEGLITLNPEDSNRMSVSYSRHD